MKKQPLTLIGSHFMAFTQLELAILKDSGVVENTATYKAISNKCVKHVAVLSETHILEEKCSEIKITKTGLRYNIYGCRRYEPQQMGAGFLDKVLCYLLGIDRVPAFMKYA